MIVILESKGAFQNAVSQGPTGNIFSPQKHLFGPNQDPLIFAFAVGLHFWLIYIPLVAS